MSKTIVLKPRVSEKAYGLSEALNVYLFEVPADTNRLEIAKAIETQYEVGVVGVRMARTPGKTRRNYKRRGRVVHRGQSSGVRKAYVTLKEGDKLTIFATVDEKTDNRPEPVREGK